MKKIVKFLVKYKSYIFLGLIIILALRVFIPQIDQLEESLKTLEQANFAWVAVGLFMFFIGLPIVAVQYMALAFRKLKFGLTLRVQMASLFVCKLLPSSIGTLTLNMYYFTKTNHTVPQATAVMTMNAITSGIAYAGLILAALLSDNFSVRTIYDDVNIPKNAIYFVVAILVGIVIALLAFGKIRHKIYLGIKTLKDNLDTYKERPGAVVIGIVANALGSFTSLLALYASARALGVDINLSSALLAYTFGNVAAGLIPTPGGLGAAEAGLYSGLVIVGVSIPEAISVTMLYRLISYWIPTIPGYYYFWDLRKTLLSKFSIRHNYADSPHT